MTHDEKIALIDDYKIKSHIMFTLIVLNLDEMANSPVVVASKFLFQDLVTVAKTIQSFKKLTEDTINALAPGQNIVALDKTEVKDGIQDNVTIS